MEEDDDPQSHDENQRRRKQRTDGRQLQQHSSVVRWIWREKKNELEESRSRREGTHTCRRHDLTESLYQVRSRRRLMGGVHRRLEKEPRPPGETAKARSLFFSLTLFFLSFRLAEFLERFERECRGSRNLHCLPSFLHLEDFHSFIQVVSSSTATPCPSSNTFLHPILEWHTEVM
jgi:hypothetical protein